MSRPRTWERHDWLLAVIFACGVTLLVSGQGGYAAWCFGSLALALWAKP